MQRKEKEEDRNQNRNKTISVVIFFIIILGKLEQNLIKAFIFLFNNFVMLYFVNINQNLNYY